uniref:Uncharacterized protein n=1 Tax=Romanomermis culicivorax TaxID=13658 RepID=A0A915I8N3_ROMCU
MENQHHHQRQFSNDENSSNVGRPTTKVNNGEFSGVTQIAVQDVGGAGENPISGTYKFPVVSKNKSETLCIAI